MKIIEVIVIHLGILSSLCVASSDCGFVLINLVATPSMSENTPIESESSSESGDDEEGKKGIIEVAYAKKPLDQNREPTPIHYEL